MGWAVTTINLPRVSNFQEAEKVWSGAEDCSERGGWRPDKRPLESKRMPHKAIVKGTSAYGTSYALCLYDTPLMTYYENGNVKVKVHSSQSSSNFFWYMKPDNIQYRGNDLLQVQTSAGVRWYQNNVDGAFTLTPGAVQGEWEVISETTQRKRTQTNLKRAAEINKALREFTGWWKGVKKLTGHAPYAVNGGGHWRLPGSLPQTFSADDFQQLTQCGRDLNSIRSALLSFYGARYSASISNDVQPLQRPRFVGDS